VLRSQPVGDEAKLRVNGERRTTGARALRRENIFVFFVFFVFFYDMMCSMFNLDAKSKILDSSNLFNRDVTIQAHDSSKPQGYYFAPIKEISSHN
jgi:hypothetical protein